MLKRVLKMFTAQGANVGVVLITQLVLPPVFLHSYGVARYGEWLVLSASIAYLVNLNFGISTYASNELTILRQRNQIDEYRRLQSSSIALTLGICLLGVLISAGISLLPLDRLFHFTTMGRAEAGRAAFFLGLGMMCHILASYYQNLFMVIQETHRGVMWWNARRLAGTLAVVPPALLHWSFDRLSFVGFIATLVIALATFVDLKLRMRGLPLGLQGANWATAKSTLKPSGMFAMIFGQTYLVFSVPVIILQRLLGPETVVLFTISRTVLGTARQFLSTLTSSIAPEITLTFGSGDRKKLLDIFHYSERVVFAMVPVANLGAFLLAPFLIHFWLHKNGLFDGSIYALMALVSGVMSMREHKQFFQFSTNTHHRLAHIMFWGNIAMILVSIPMTVWFGVRGFMVTWLVSESVQMGLLYFENKKLFDADPSITMWPVLKLGALMGLALPACMAVVNYSRHHGQVEQGALAALGATVIFLVCYWLFGLNVVQQRVLARWSARRQASLV